MSAKGTSDWRARERVGEKPLKLIVNRAKTIALLKRDGVLKHPPGSYAGREFTWAEVEAAAQEFWNSLFIADAGDEM